MSTARGFTLLEIVLSLGIVAALAGGLMGFFWELLDRRTQIETAAERRQGAGALIEHIEAGLACGLSGDDGSGAGIQGTTERLVLLSRGVWMALQQEAGAAGDLQGSEYTFDRGSGAIRVRRWSGAHADAAEAETLCDGVELLRFRYYDGSQWSGAFDSLQKKGLPVAIEVAVWFGEPQPLEPTGTVNDPRKVHALPTRDPDRVRLVIVPDGPVQAWKEGR
jgi:type II secretory pathway pseudopilin PulG